MNTREAKLTRPPLRNMKRQVSLKRRWASVCLCMSHLGRWRSSSFLFYTNHSLYYKKWEEPEQLSRYSNWLWAGRPRSRSLSPGRIKNLLFSKSSRPALGPIQPTIKWVPRAFSMRVKRPGREADHSKLVPRSNWDWAYGKGKRVLSVLWLPDGGAKPPLCLTSLHSAALN
jgi:hypothetical protein